MFFFGKKICALVILCLSILFWGCDDDQSTEKILPPDIDPFFTLFPNDRAQNDSAAANLTHGIFIPVHPRATYQLSFDVDPDHDAPELQLFRVLVNTERQTYIYKQVRTLKPKVVAGRYVYEFICEENSANLWATSLSLDKDFFPGKVSNVRLTGEGAYSDHFSINLIAVGNIEDEIEGYTLKELATSMLKGFRKYYSSVTIDTLYIKHAHEHPTLGKKYRKDEPWISDVNSDDMMLSELGGWPGSENALDIVLVHYINGNGILGYSDLFSGNMGGGYGSTVLLGAHYITPYGTQEDVSMQSIVETALHETGHFFGLRHTTASIADMSNPIGSYDFGDYSNVEDGLDDTPYCPKAQIAGLLKNSATDLNNPNRRYRIRIFEKAGSFNIENCPDADNMMFPTAIDNLELSFSKQQLQIIRKSLMIYPH